MRQLSALSSPLVRTKVALTGNSDAAGEGTFNLALSVARAEAVRAMLQKRGVDPDLLAVRGAGTLEPANPGDTQAARTANRRVSFSVTVQEQQ
jgi:outer membrane protein OmpA-like peptidoglycan-associated protein